MPGTYDLKLHSLAIELDGSNLLLQLLADTSPSSRSGSTYEVDANRGDVTLGVGIICESKEQAGLSDTRVSDKQKLEEVVVSIRLQVSVRSLLQSSTRIHSSSWDGSVGHRGDGVDGQFRTVTGESSIMAVVLGVATRRLNPG